MYIGAYFGKKAIYPVSYGIVFLLRRSLFMCITFLLYDYPGIQIQVFIYSTILYIIYLNFHRIYDLPVDLFLENLNEVFFILALYHLVLFSNLVSEPTILDRIGSSMIACISLILALGTLIIIFVNIKTLFRKLKLYRCKIS